MDTAGIKAVDLFWFLLGISKRNQGNGYNMLWKIEKLHHVPDPVFTGLNTQPYRTYAQFIGGQQDILCCSRTVLD